MKTLLFTIFFSTLPFTSIVAYNELQSYNNVQEIEYIRSLPVQVQVAHEDVEVEFLPEATVIAVDSEIEIDFVAEQRDVSCNEYTCTFTPLDAIALRAER